MSVQKIPNLWPRFGFLVLCFSVLAACAPTEEINALKQRTLDNLVFVEGGTFMMGDVGYVDENGQKQIFGPDADAFPVHQVTLSSYSIFKYEVTYADYDLFAEVTARDIPSQRFRKEEYTGPNYPVSGVTWHESRAYCQWLGEQIGYPMDLPTEAQWEYAARSRGKAVAYATDNGKFEPGRNIRDAKQIWHEMPVGSWPPNPLGIHDMTGNVDEWTLDWWHPYNDKPKNDPRYETVKYQEYASHKVTRGSGIIGGRGQITLYVRVVREPDNTGSGIGIRCVANHPEPITTLRETP